MKTKEVTIGEFFQDIGIPAGARLEGQNGEVLTYDSEGRLRDSQGRYGYLTHFGGLYVCYNCGHLCDCEGI